MIGWTSYSRDSLRYHCLVCLYSPTYHLTVLIHILPHCPHSHTASLSLFTQPCVLPGIDLDNTFSDYRGFSETIITEESLPSYVRAKKRLEELLPYEEQLVSSSDLDIFYQYIDKLQQLKEEWSLVDTVYQRAIACHPLEVDLWKRYLLFLVKIELFLCITF